MMTEAPFSVASIAAGSPVAPAPTITTSATLSQWRGAFAASTEFAPPTTAVAPTPVSAVLTKSLLDQPFFGCRCLATFSSRTDRTAQQREVMAITCPLVRRWLGRLYARWTNVQMGGAQHHSSLVGR